MAAATLDALVRLYKRLMLKTEKTSRHTLQSVKNQVWQTIWGAAGSAVATSTWSTAM